MEEKVKKLIETEVNKLGISVDNVTYEKEGSNYFLRIIIDRDEPIDIDTCVEVTEVINPLLDSADFLKDSYILDVSTKEKGVKDE
ncbi:MAG: hypothetical protein IKI04_00515 [Bacilli bacterium]|nr:hypothetical protein [Bacilli bacterium]